LREMEGKLALIFVAVVATGVLVLPQTVTLFAGQHYWYNLSDTGNDVPCEKCHADIASEMESHAGPHMDETGFGTMDCEFCHRAVFAGYDYASVSGGYSQYTAGEEAHAASVIRCMACHSTDLGPTLKHSSVQTLDCVGCHADHESSYPSPSYVNHFSSDTYTNDDCRKCHADVKVDRVVVIPGAGGFNLTRNSTDSGALEAHMAFINESKKDTTLLEENEACLGCHTGIAVKINWTHATSLEFDAGLGTPVVTDYGPHNWTLTQWAVNGTALATTWGNTTGYGTTTYSSNWPGEIGDVYS